MGLEVAALALAVAGTAYSIDQQQQARREQGRAKKEQGAVNAARAAQEKRQQVRQERVRRAQILQASANTGVSEGSGELGSVGNLSTQLSAGLGFNSGQLSAANRISDFNQNASDALSRANTGQQIGGLAFSIFQGMGGFNSTGPKTPTTGTQPANVSRGGSFSTSN